MGTCQMKTLHPHSPTEVPLAHRGFGIRAGCPLPHPYMGSLLAPLGLWHPHWMCLFTLLGICACFQDQWNACSSRIKTDPTRSTIHEQSQTVDFFLQTEQLPDHPDVSGDRLREGR